MNHAIRSQHLHIDFQGSEADAKRLHDRLPDWCQSHLLPMLEITLDGYALPADSYWQIERLDINIESIALDRLEQDLPVLIGQALQQSLRAKTPAFTLENSLFSPLFNNLSVESDNIKLQSGRQRLTAVFIHFLQTGALPWHYKTSENETLEQSLLKAWHENPSDFEAEALRSVLNSAITRKRLVRQFSESFLKTLLARLTPDAQQPIISLSEAFKQENLPAETTHAFILALWEAAFEPGKQSSVNFPVLVWQNLPPINAIQHERLASVLDRYWPGATGASQLLASWTDRSISQQPTDKDRNAISDAPSPLPLAAKPVGPQHTDTNDLPINTHPEAQTGIYIDNAGLVLLHPFLPQFFQALNVAEGHQLVEPERALCLLHFLATGQKIAPEYQLPLPKVLCNLPLTWPVESDLGLSDAECQEAEALLAAMIGHWNVLKNTGIGGLRSAFLLRTGKITLREDGDWLLKVETQGYDILLEQLPWGIGTIKLPWMPTILWVEWA